MLDIERGEVSDHDLAVGGGALPFNAADDLLHRFVADGFVLGLELSIRVLFSGFLELVVDLDVLLQ